MMTIKEDDEVSPSQPYPPPIITMASPSPVSPSKACPPPIITMPSSSPPSPVSPSQACPPPIITMPSSSPPSSPVSLSQPCPIPLINTASGSPPLACWSNSPPSGITSSINLCEDKLTSNLTIPNLIAPPSTPKERSMSPATSRKQIPPKTRKRTVDLTEEEAREVRFSLVKNSTVDKSDDMEWIAENVEHIGHISSLGENVTSLTPSATMSDEFNEVEVRLFQMFGNREKKIININKFLLSLISSGMRHDDPRLQEMLEKLQKVQELQHSSSSLLRGRRRSSLCGVFNVNYKTFMSIISENMEIVVKALSSTFVIRNFRQLCNKIDEFYRNGKSNHEGRAATYIPQLARTSSHNWGVAVCTVDGQRYAVGNVNTPFTLQSCSKPLAYAVAVGEYGSTYIHNHVGMEPSGRNFDELLLDESDRPHNPMINAGAIMISYLIKRQLCASDRFNYVYNQYKRMCEPEYVGFNNGIFLSEQESERVDGIYALAYFMKENKCFAQDANIQEIINFYLQICSLEITVESGAVIAATLANGGINPLTGEAVLTNEAVRDTLTLMYSCGMNNYSGQFSFLVGLPAKSSVCGCILLVIPNTMGICLWSPPLDIWGNSSRGVQFCKDLISVFNFHHFDNLRGHVNIKRDPRMAKAESRAHLLFDLLFSAAAGDLSSLKRHAISGTDMGTSDYDGRTPLHVAASEGHPELVDFLLEECHIDPLPRDRWGRTPLDDSSVFGHHDCFQVFIRYLEKCGIEPPPPFT